MTDLMLKQREILLKAQLETLLDYKTDDETEKEAIKEEIRVIEAQLDYIKHIKEELL